MCTNTFLQRYKKLSAKLQISGNVNTKNALPPMCLIAFIGGLFSKKVPEN